MDTKVIVYIGTRVINNITDYCLEIGFYTSVVVAGKTFSYYDHTS